MDMNNDQDLHIIEEVKSEEGGQYFFRIFDIAEDAMYHCSPFFCNCDWYVENVIEKQYASGMVIFYSCPYL